MIRKTILSFRICVGLVNTFTEVLPGDTCRFFLAPHAEPGNSFCTNSFTEMTSYQSFWKWILYEIKNGTAKSRCKVWIYELIFKIIKSNENFQTSLLATCLQFLLNFYVGSKSENRRTEDSDKNLLKPLWLLRGLQTEYLDTYRRSERCQGGIFRYKSDDDYDIL